MANTQTFEIIICDQNSTPSLKMGEYLLDKEKGIMYVGSDIPIERVSINKLFNITFGANFRSNLQKLFATENIKTVEPKIAVDLNGNLRVLLVIQWEESTNVYVKYGTQIPHLSYKIEKV